MPTLNCSRPIIGPSDVKLGHPEGEAQVNLSRADLEEKICPKQVGAAGRHFGYRSDIWFSSDSSDRRLEDSFCIIQILVQIGSSSFGFRLVWVVEGFRPVLV